MYPCGQHDRQSFHEALKVGVIPWNVHNPQQLWEIRCLVLDAQCEDLDAGVYTGEEGKS